MLKINKILLFFFIIILNFSMPAQCDIVIGYFNPESNFPSAEIIRITDEYFKTINKNIIIQPISKISGLKTALESFSLQYMIISPAYIEYLKSDYEFNLLLQPLDEKGKNTYTKKILCNKIKIKNISELERKTLASSIFGEIGEILLDKYIFSLPESKSVIKAENLEILGVKKDIDAIFALIFGQVDAAIVSQSTINILKKDNSEYFKDLIEILDSNQFPMPYLYSLQNQHSNDIERIFLNMNSTTEGVKALNILGVQKWIK